MVKSISVKQWINLFVKSSTHLFVSIDLKIFEDSNLWNCLSIKFKISVSSCIGFRSIVIKACFKRRILHASNSVVSIMYMLSATSETIKFDVSKCGRPKL